MSWFWDIPQPFWNDNLKPCAPRFSSKYIPYQLYKMLVSLGMHLHGQWDKHSKDIFNWSLDNCPVNLRSWQFKAQPGETFWPGNFAKQNWKFVAKYGISYFIMLPNNVTQKHFVFPFLRYNFIMCICFVPNATSNCKLVTSAPLFRLC